MFIHHFQNDYPSSILLLLMINRVLIECEISLIVMFFLFDQQQRNAHQYELNRPGIKYLEELLKSNNQHIRVEYCRIIQDLIC